MNINALFAIIFVFIGCCSNVVFLELLIKVEPSSGNIITCGQFIFIALHGFLFTSNFGKKKNIIPIKDYMVLVVMFFIVNVTNNIAFGFKISMPLHIIFRSGGLIASMIMGMIVLGRRYSIAKYASVILITIGTILCTMASSNHIEADGDAAASFTTWLLGVAILSFALLMSARMGIFQECLYTRHGKHPEEALYYIHMLSLPAFILTGPSIIAHIYKFNNSLPLEALAGYPVIEFVPRLWLYIIGNVLAQYVCISSVFKLTSECSALTVTLVLTLRKFISLIFSIIYFKNPFVIMHWFGTILVFGGTVLFADVPNKVLDLLRSKSKKD